MRRKDNAVMAIGMIVLGLLLIVLKGGVVDIAMTVFAVSMIVTAILDFVNKRTNDGIIKAVLGVCILVFGWMFVNLALYILGAVLIVMGLMLLVNLRRGSMFEDSNRALNYIRPIVMVVAGVCLLFNQGGTIDWIFIVGGIMLLIEGLLELVG